MSTLDPWGEFDRDHQNFRATETSDPLAEFGVHSGQRRRKNRLLRIVLIVGIPAIVLVIGSELFNAMQGRSGESASSRLETPRVSPVVPAVPSADSRSDRAPDVGQKSSETLPGRAADRPKDVNAFIASMVGSLVLVECQISDGTYSQGSGFAMATQELNLRSGTVLVTSWHVVEDCLAEKPIVLTTADGATYVASVSDADVAADIALLDAPELSIPALSSESDPSQGDWVMAIGNPQGVTGTVTVGVVSSLKPGEIYSDAAIAPGSSGGPLVNNQGAVVGITSWVFTDASNFSISRDIDSLCDMLVSCS